MKKIKNGPIERLIRTLGFILVLIATLFLTIEYLDQFSLKFIEPVKEFLVNEVDFLEKFKYTFFISGLLLLIWTQNRNIFVRVLTTLTFIFSVIGLTIIHSDKNILPFNLSSITVLESFFMDMITKFNWFEFAIIVAPAFLIYLIFAYRKPSRISISALGAGIILLIIAVIGTYLPLIFTQLNFLESEIAVKIILGIKIGGTGFALLGSSFGVLGLFRK